MKEIKDKLQSCIHRNIFFGKIRCYYIRYENNALAKTQVIIIYFHFLDNRFNKDIILNLLTTSCRLYLFHFHTDISKQVTTLEF